VEVRVKGNGNKEKSLFGSVPKSHPYLQPVETKKGG
jgi:hypothetical protein